MSETIKTKDAKKGGYLVGKPHSEGGIKGINVDTGQPIEVEGGEVVITKPAVESNRTYEFEGKQMKPKEILSKINSEHGGVSFAKGGVMKTSKYEEGGVIQEYINNNPVSENYKNVRKVLFETDNMGLDNYNLRKIEYVELRKDNIVVVDDGQNPFLIEKTISIGDWAFLGGYYFQYFSDSKIVKTNLDQDSVYPLKPWQLKKIESSNNDLQLHFIREVNGIIQKVILPKTDSESNSIIAHSIQVIPNICAILPDNFSETDEIIYPADNGTGFSDAWMYGKLGVEVMHNSNLIASKLYYYQHEIKSSNLQGCYGKEFYGTSYSYYLNRDKWLTSSFEEVQEEYRFATIGDVVDIGIDETVSKGLREVVSYQEDDLFCYTCEFVSDKNFNAENIGGKKRNDNYDSDDNNIVVWLENCRILGLFLELPIIRKSDDSFIWNYPEIDWVIFEYDNRLYAVNEDRVRIGNIRELAQPTISTTTPISDFEKQKKRARKKVVNATEPYQILKEIVNDEINKLTILSGVANTIGRKFDIDRKLAELREQRDMYELKSDTITGLLDKLAAVNNQPKFTEEMPDMSLLAPNGQPTELTNQQWHTVRTENFIEWFGDWLLAYEMQDYTEVSKVINPTTQEPLVLYHGSRADFIRWKFDRFPAAYFADNLSYSQWFAENQTTGEESVLYQVFVNMKNPLDMRTFGYTDHSVREYLEYMRDTYNIPFIKGTPMLLQYQKAGQQAVEQFMEHRLPFWSFIRHVNQGLLTYLRDESLYDGIIMYEHNPSDLINGQPNVTNSYVIFRTEQVKWASANHYNAAVKDSRFQKGGVTIDKKKKRVKTKYAKSAEQQAIKLLNDLDFVF
jgi:hypothetical protein